MRILLHDYAGHPFQVQLSRSLARRGHQVRHVYCRSLQTPRGAIVATDGDPETFDIAGVDVGGPIAKYSFRLRRAQERRYGRLVVAELNRFDPEIVISSNAPPDAQWILQQQCLAEGRKFVFWLQDVYSFGVERVLRRRLPILWRPIAWHYRRLEQSMLSRSDRVILITEDFRSALDWTRTSRQAVHVIENWAPLDEVPVRRRANAWSAKHGLDGKLCFLYSGTLGLKHNPDLLLQLALSIRNDPKARVVVISEGLGAEWLRARKAEYRLDNLLILDFQPFELLPEVLAAGDILMAILEPDAGVFSVPSKVLTYLCAARPLLLAVPTENLSARIVSQSQAGIIVPPTDGNAFVQAALRLRHDLRCREWLGGNARAYAERTFNLQTITDRFEQVLS